MNFDKTVLHEKNFKPVKKPLPVGFMYIKNWGFSCPVFYTPRFIFHIPAYSGWNCIFYLKLFLDFSNCVLVGQLLNCVKVCLHRRLRVNHSLAPAAPQKGCRATFGILFIYGERVFLSLSMADCSAIDKRATRRCLAGE